MIIAPFSAAALLSIAMNLREWDRKEIFATRADHDLNSFVNDLLFVAASPKSITRLIIADRPIYAVGFFELWPGVWSSFGFSTLEFPVIGRQLTRYLVREAVPALREFGAHRVECRSMEGHVEAQAWIEKLGYVREGVLLDYGRNRETYFSYAWRQSDHGGA